MVMINENYNLRFTPNTRKLVSNIIEYGFSIRDILNAGIVLFYKANMDDRGRAVMESNSEGKPELDESVKQLQKVVYDINYELLNEEDARRVRQLREILGPSAAAAAADEAAAARDAQADKRNRNQGTDGAPGAGF